MKSCDNPLGCACYEANGYSLTDCEYFVGIDSQQDIIEDDIPELPNEKDFLCKEQIWYRSPKCKNKCITCRYTND